MSSPPRRLVATTGRAEVGTRPGWPELAENRIQIVAAAVGPSWRPSSTSSTGARTWSPSVSRTAATSHAAGGPGALAARRTEAGKPRSLYDPRMVKLIVLYGQPTDPEAFDAHYFSTHAGLVEKMPGVERFEVARCASMDGSAPAYYLQAELWFEDANALQACFASPEGQATAGDVGNFATGGATMLIGDVVAG